MPSAGVRNAYSSLGRSVAAYQPYYAPPVTPQTNYITGGSAVASTVDQGGQKWDQHSRLATRAPRRLGIRTLFSYGDQPLRWFRFIATGRVESTKFQPTIRHTWDGEFNDAIYQAGYPRNLGLTFKVVTVNPGINAPWTMQPRTDFRGRSIFVNRRPTTSGIQAVPATRTNGSYS